jgi:DNA topoisomerase-2
MNSLNSNDIDTVEQRDHIYLRPGTYIGSITQELRYEYVFDSDTSKIVKKEISIPPGLERIFIELLANAADNAYVSRENKINVGTINITIKDNYITVRNEGRAISIEKYEKLNMWLPNVIFGVLMSSSNYKDQIKKRTGSGLNGLGAKLTNIFSLDFRIEIGNSHNKKKYIQEWKDNMKICKEPIIEKYNGMSYTQITYLADLNKFGYIDYPEETYSLFAKHILDATFTSHVPIIFNGIEFPPLDIITYTQYYIDITNHFIHSEKDMILCVLDSPNKGMAISFVNGMVTKNGGTHVRKVMETIGIPILKNVNEKNKPPKINLNKFKDHVTIVLSCRFENPDFDAQTKTKLTSPKMSDIQLNIPDSKISHMMSWELVDALKASLLAINYKNLLKTDGKKKNFIGEVDEYNPANKAGTKESNKCILYLSEGKSAMAYVNTFLDELTNGRDYNGTYQLRGKVLNAINAKDEKILESRIWINIKKILGLEEKTNYEIDSNMNRLRYGGIHAMVDADDDGKHIFGLILVYFYKRFPSLLKRKYISLHRTPIIRVTKGKIIHNFFSQLAYNKWAKKKNDDELKKWNHKYFKGLGTFEDALIKENFKNQKVANCIFDENAEAYISLAFNSKLSNYRKVWVEQYKPILGVEDLIELPITKFINEELIYYTLNNLKRAIPNEMDGLKESQRKLLYAGIKKWGCPKDISKCEEYKVVQFASYAAGKTCYHHGEECLSGTVIKMGQDFVGSNNMPYFYRSGQFGSQMFNGSDAASPRYLYTFPEWWWSYIYKKEDNDLLIYVEDEGKEWEPEFFLPIIPMQLVNGASGVAMGWSTSIYNHNPLDIIQWLKNKLTRKENVSILPWYRNFEGNIEIDINTFSVENTYIGEYMEEYLGPEEDILNKENEDFDYNNYANAKISMSTYGKFVQYPDRIVVTALPLGLSTNKYKRWLIKLREKGYISKCDDKGKKYRIEFHIMGWKNEVNLSKLGLIKRYGMTNMILLGENGLPKKYRSSDEILESFYIRRLPYYKKRIDLKIKQIEDVIPYKENTIKFIEGAINEKIPLLGKKEEDILNAMTEMNLLYIEDLLKIPIKKCSLESIVKLKNEIQEDYDLLENMKQKTPEQEWFNELVEFEIAYKKYYKIKC